MPHAQFVPLRIFSSYTMLDGAIDPKAIAKTAAERGFPAAAITDRNGLYGSVAYAKACKDMGVQPIIGTMLAVARPDRDGAATGFGPAAPTIDWLALYAQDSTGYDNLCHLVSRAHLDRPLEFEAHVTLADFIGHTDGLICLTAAGEGALVQLLAGQQQAAAQAYLDRLQELFPQRLYLEVARRNDAQEEAAEEALIDLAYAHDLPLVATNPARFAERGFYDAHDAMLCIASSTHVDSTDRPRSSREWWIKPAEVMEDLFKDLPEALANTLVVAQRCAVMPPKRKPILPSLAGDQEGEARLCATDSRTGLVARLKPYYPDAAHAELEQLICLGPDAQPDAADYPQLNVAGVWEEVIGYRDRLEFEVGIINRMGFGGYFLIVADFIKWAKEQGIPVGPGRGSGAGSLVAWALTITDLDPIKLGLLFERFLNPERVSMPDFDIDFCETRRGEVIRYVQRKYGLDHVAQIITFGKLKARAVLRDTGRILQMSYGQTDRLCKMVPNHPTDPWPLPRALNGVLELKREYDRDPEVKRLIDLAMQLEGLPRNSSTHAAGVVIGDRPLAQLVPLYRDPRSDMPVTQFDMKHVEDAGLVKFDFLGLKTLSVLRKAVDLMGKRGIEIDLSALAWDDEQTYKLLQSGDTVGVFQLESEGMRRTLAAVKPTNFGDIIALVSLYRPGPMDNIPLFGRRKNGLEAIEYPHEKLSVILAETYGIFVYQEQVMQAAQILAGYSLGDADLLRRAMGKKVQAEMDAQRQRFVDGCKEVSDIPAAKANELFDLIDKFAGYGFNKSHAAAYALLAYQTAWLKTHYPHEFYAASMCFDMHQSEKLSVFVDDMRRNGVALAGPDINHSEAEYTVEKTSDGFAVRYALAGLRNVGEKAMEQIVAEREANGPFTSLDDLFKRIPAGSMNRRQLEALAAGGALDGLEPNRAQVIANAELLMAVADEAARSRTSGQGGLFGGDDHAAPATRLAPTKAWSRADQMAAERENFGFYFAAHPVEEYRAVASANGARSYGSLMSGEGEPGGRSGAVMAALVENVQKRKTKKGKDFVMADFSDNSGLFSASCFEEGLVEPFQQWAKDGTCVLLNVELDRPNPDEPPRITVRGARPLASVSSASQMQLKLDVSSPQAIAELALLLPRGSGARGEVLARLRTGGPKEPLIRLGNDFKLDSDLIERLIPIEGLANVSLTARPERHLRLVE
ncbi:MAG: DNA polymerase III subunit alpha [Novosphingobium sp. 28-62-57]|uniref:DNA polymerase III subunit alpha n=1 Tax=Novosphingobium sp. 28-62-57 TaxID=1970409 RepID=UPI000BD666FA|nr:DNA polymerase III subunit alpha [Novosphingobium sp. 28-62-57]OYW49789.1 MAG: DNA polymerase III subunit alpha [Novosphingobium sp. 12-62-10]OYZ12255.1 MAG: DNA polymerase III subunit alpha [Novosphingobium sp. 28-62-57]OZA35725.1 MAG: DNA polymerase III subunit alpha [Novosphingobium sp. 17-62-9]